MKDIILPWTCESSDRLRSISKWFLLISAPLIGFHFILSLDKIVPLSYSPVSELCYGIFGTFIFWMIQFITWEMNGDLPSIRCKNQEQDNERYVLD